jgi:hypothetical protein
MHATIPLRRPGGPGAGRPVGARGGRAGAMAVRRPVGRTRMLRRASSPARRRQTHRIRRTLQKVTDFTAL